MSSTFNTMNRQKLMDKGEEIETNMASPQGKYHKWNIFQYSLWEKFKKSLKKWIRPETKHSYAKTTNPPKELIFADNSNFPTLSKAEWEFLKGIIKETLAEDNLIVNRHKTEETIINQLKDQNHEEWRKTKKLGSLLGCYEDMRRPIQLSANAIKKTWYHWKIHINKKLQLYKSIVKAILLYNSGNWGLTKKEQNEIDVTYRGQLRTLINNKKISNNKI